MEQLQPLDVVVFDCGGVILTVQDSEQYNAALAFVGEALGIEASKAKDAFYCSDEWKDAKVGKMTCNEMFDKVCAKHGVTDARTISKITEYIRLAGRGVHPAMQKLLDDLQPLREDGKVRVVVLSNYENSLDDVLSGFPSLAGKFEFVLNSAVIGLAKPDPLVYEFTMQRLGLNASSDSGRILFIDDKKRNTDVAEEICGWSTVVFKDKEGDVQRIRTLLNMA